MSAARSTILVPVAGTFSAAMECSFLLEHRMANTMLIQQLKPAVIFRK